GGPTPPAGFLARDRTSPRGARTPQSAATARSREPCDPGLEREDARTVSVHHALVAEGPLVGDPPALPHALDGDDHGVVLLGAEDARPHAQGVEVAADAVEVGAGRGGGGVAARGAGATGQGDRAFRCHALRALAVT